MIGATEETSVVTPKALARVLHPNIFKLNITSYFIMEIPRWIIGQKASDEFYKAK